MENHKTRFHQYDLTALKEEPIPEVRVIARQLAREGQVLLENTKGTLPLKKGDKVSLFGRGQLEYTKSGTGSGGNVNGSYVPTILECLQKSEMVELNEKLISIYTEWLKDHPFDKGHGWATEPWAQVEMPVSDELAKEAAEVSDKAIIIITRTAGEDKDNSKSKGSWYLQDEEEALIQTVRSHFDHVCVVLNVGNIIDMSWVKKYDVDAVLYAWQGGEAGAEGTTDVLLGASPSGKLSDTIAKTIEDYPSDKNFGDIYKNIYEEDIYVGYRYFETFKKEAVLYPFGYGMSYTKFSIKAVSSKMEVEEKIKVTVKAKVKNIGDVEGKEVVQLYMSAPQGKLGKAAKELVAFAKTRDLKPGETQTVTLSFLLDDFAAYDDSGVTGHKNCYILEGGQYLLCLGTDVSSAEAVYAYAVEEKVVRQCKQALAPVEAFKRLRPGENGEETYEDTPLRDFDIYKRIQSEQGEALPFTGDKGIKLQDVKLGKATMDAFISQLSDTELIELSRGEGMCSPKVTPGTGSCFGGVTDSLLGYGIPIACTTDGPSGLRMDPGLPVTSLPNGTLLTCTFNLPLVYELFVWESLELIAYKIDALLGPGINIHRHPLNGRNFEYFSEDPFLAGRVAAAMSSAFDEMGVTCTVKHFCCNNQEFHRHDENSVLSERALREIYIRPFEIAVKDGNVQAIMTSYNLVNGLHAASCYDLTTTILREEWGYAGFVMTDWWARTNIEGKSQTTRDLGPMVQAQNDVYMVCPNAKTQEDRGPEGLAAGECTRYDLQRNAKNTLTFLMNTYAMDRLIRDGVVKPIEIPDVKTLEKVATFDNLQEIKTFDLKVDEPGTYAYELTYKADATVLAQISLSFLYCGHKVAFAMVNGTDGQLAKVKGTMNLEKSEGPVRWYINNSALKFDSISFFKL